MGLARDLAAVPLWLAERIVSALGEGTPSPSSGARARPVAVPDWGELVARFDELEKAVGELADLPREWQHAVQDIEDGFQRLELKRNRLSATEARLRKTEKKTADPDEPAEGYESELARAEHLGRKAGQL